MSLPAKKAEGRGGGASLLCITTQQVARQKKNNLHRRISALFASRRPFLALQRSRDGHREAQRQSRVCRRAGRHARNTSARRLSSFARVADG